MIKWSFGSGGIVLVPALRDMIRNYQINHPDSRLCIELLLLDDAAFSTKLNEVLAASEEERKKV